MRHLSRTLDELRALAPENFELLVRGRYPMALVQPQHSLGTLDPFTRVWYVYRDGAPEGAVGEARR